MNQGNICTMIQDFFHKDFSKQIVTNDITEVSHMTILRHLASLGYKNNLPLKTPMLTIAHKEACVSWAMRHLNDNNWEITLFSDEAAFRLFRDTITQWYKGERPV